MSVLTVDIEGFGLCDYCDVYYQVVFNINPVYDRIEYCPFCGDNIEDIILESEEK